MAAPASSRVLSGFLRAAVGWWVALLGPLFGFLRKFMLLPHPDPLRAAWIGVRQKEWMRKDEGREVWHVPGGL